ncbi:hypothetical protein EJB10_04425 [Wolbachia endosymbiont of Brugia malayi]|nr:hypothetical protein [Wolbachia endosymbiont of Brugia malayi]AAW70992.1 Predicted protein, WF-1 [Wolbachia endosymbiont strain TRS of Brugia malayi]QCB61944.1 hypothetical protein EJB10_04425 [Wolbachia endosymbiont of Brugia malayi]
MKYIISKLVLQDGKIRHSFYHDNGMIEQEISRFVDDLNAQCKKIKSDLEKIAYESIVSRSKQIQNRLEVERDNKYLYVKYIKDSVVKPAKIINNQEVEKLGLRVYIL